MSESINGDLSARVAEETLTPAAWARQASTRGRTSIRPIFWRVMSAWYQMASGGESPRPVRPRVSQAAAASRPQPFKGFPAPIPADGPAPPCRWR